MEMKKILRSGLALLCCASLVLGSLGMIIPVVKAAGSSSAYAELTPAMLGVPDAVDETTDQKGLTLTTPKSEEKLYELDKMKFSAKVHFQSQGLSYFTYLFNESGHGQISFMVNANATSSLLVYNYRNTGEDTNLYFGDKIASGVDIETAYTKLKKNDDSSYGRVLGSSAGYGFIGTNAPISLTTEFVDFDGDGAKDDLEIGIFVSGYETKAKYGYYKDYEETIFKGVVSTYQVKAISSPTVTNPATPYTPPAPTVYGDLTPAMLGISDASDIASGTTLTTPKEAVKLYNLDKTKFSANVHYQSSGLSHFTYLFNEAGRGQLTFSVNANASSSLLLYNYRMTGDTTLYFGDKIKTGVDIETAYTKIKNDETNCGYILGSSKGCSFIGKNATISITTEFVDFDGDGAKDDLEIGILIAGHEDKPYYAYYKNYNETIFRGVMSATNLKAISSPTVENPATPYIPPVDLTPSMLGIADTADIASGATLTTPTESVELYNVDNTKFSANVHYQSSGLSHFTYLYNEAGRGQLTFSVNANASSSLLLYNYRMTGDTTLYFGSKIEAGVDIETAYTKIKNDETNCGYILGSSKGCSFIGKNATISITTKFVDFDSDGAKDDLEIQIVVTGHEDKPYYAYYKNYDETIFRGVMSATNLKAISSPTVTNPATPYVPPVETVYGELTPAVLGITNTTDEAGVTLMTPTEAVKLYNLDKTKFIANVHYHASQMSHFAYLFNEAGQGQLTFIVNPNGSSSLLLSNYKTTGDTTLYFGPKIADGVDIETAYTEIASGGNSHGYILGSSKGCNFIGKNATISITTEFVDFDGDGAKDDLEIGIVVTGHEDKPYYAYYKNYEETTFKGIMSTNKLVSVFSPEITNQAVPVTPTVEPPTDPATPPTFPEITFSDFGDMDNGVYGYNGVDLAVSGSNPEGFANKTFVGTVKFSEQQSTRIDFAGKASPWYGIHLLTRNGNKLYLQEADNYFAPVLIEESNDFTWKNKPVQIRLVFEVSDLDVDGEEDDLRLWLYLNGNLYKNKPIVKAIDYADHLGNFLGIYSDNDASTVEITSAIIERPKQEIDFSMMGFTKDWEKTFATGSNVANSGSVSNQAPHTGDSGTASIYVIGCILALIICGGVLYNKKQSKREND